MGINNSPKVEVRMHRFFANEGQISKNQICITGLDVNHIKNVLRMKIGDEIVVGGSDNLEYTCVIKEIADEEIIVEIKHIKETNAELPSRIYLFQGLPKGDKMELIIQKCVELGAFEIVPVAMKHCVVKLDKKRATAKVKRWQTIAESAAKQAGRTIIPQILEVKNFAEAVEYAKELDVCIMPYERAVDIKDTRKFLNKIKAGQSIGIFIGPEGGFADEEVAVASAANFKTVTLGKRILRTETAGITTLSILMFLMEEA